VSRRVARATVVISIAIATIASLSGSASAAVYAQGEFLYTNTAGLCVETAASTVVTGSCSVGLSFDSLIVVADPDEDGRDCTAVWSASAPVGSPSSGSFVAEGFAIIQSGVGTFDGVGTDGLREVAVHQDFTTSRCSGQLSVTSVRSGTYQLSAP